MKMKVVYEDGTKSVYKIKPRHLIAYEDEHGEFAESARSAFSLAHLASDTDKSFDDWIREVDDITAVPERGDRPQTAAKADGGGEPVPTE